MNKKDKIWIEEIEPFLSRFEGVIDTDNIKENLMLNNCLLYEILGVLKK